MLGVFWDMDPNEQFTLMDCWDYEWCWECFGTINSSGSDGVISLDPNEQFTLGIVGTQNSAESVWVNKQFREWCGG